MKILLDISNFINSTGGGIYYYLKGLLPALSKEVAMNNSEIEFLNIYFRNKISSIPIEIKSNKLNQFRFPVKLLNKLWINYKLPDLKHFYKNIDIVHSPHFSLPVLKNAKKILTVHDITYLKHPEFFDPKWKKLNDYGYKHLLPINIKRSDHIIAISNFTKNDIIDYFNIPAEKITTVYTGVDSPQKTAKDIACKYLKQYKLIQNEYIYFPAGTLEPRKNIQLTIDAFNKATLPENIKLLISGVGKVDFLNMHLSDRVKLLSWNSLEERNILYQNSLFVVYPSLYEGFGMPLIEAMSNQKAVITSNSTSLGEIGTNFAYTINPESQNQLIDAFLYFLDDKQRMTYEKKSSIRARDFSWEKMAKGIYKIYNNILLK